MTQIKCPNCGTMSPTSALQCPDCGLPFSSLPSSAFISADTEEQRIYEPEPYGAPLRSSYGSEFSRQPYTPYDETGSKTFMWYRVYLGVLAVLYLLVSVVGIGIAYLQPASNSGEQFEMLLTGMIYAVMGAVFFIAHIVALSLPAKPYNWIVGIVMIALGMTSCCLWPATIPLLIYWIKPETRSFFGRT